MPPIPSRSKASAQSQGGYSGGNMARQFHNKLVRDRIPDIIRRAGKDCATEPLLDHAYQQALRDKLEEEAQEVATAPPATLVQELADLYEVIDSLLATHSISDSAVRAEQQRRRTERGGFEQRIWLHWTEDEEDGAKSPIR